MHQIFFDYPYLFATGLDECLMDVLHNITKLTISIKRNTTTILNAKFWEVAKLKKISNILEKNIILYILYIF